MLKTTKQRKPNINKKDKQTNKQKKRISKQRKEKRKVTRTLYIKTQSSLA